MTSLSITKRKAELCLTMSQVRERTLELFAQVPEPYLKRRVHDFYSPIGWHFGHVAMTEEFWVCEQALGKPCRDEATRFLFANLPENPKDGRVHLPERAEIVGYLAATRARVLEALEEANFENANPLLTNGYAWDFALQHECQHQETILEMLMLIRQDEGKIAPIEPVEWKRGSVPKMQQFAGGTFHMGSDDPNGYDNEKQRHSVTVAPFEMETIPVTAYEWSLFMADGSYSRRELWTSDGWAWRQNTRAERPEYWLAEKIEGQYACWSPAGLRTILPDEPAASLSWYEADVYARWAGKRLPTEAEWEWAAQDALSGTSHVWEWTSSPFLPYPGFVAFPYAGYSQDHFDGKHFVCRGGSWATNARIVRPSFRNWYVPTYRQGILGVRCARNR